VIVIWLEGNMGSKMGGELGQLKENAMWAVPICGIFGCHIKQKI
jgi:hypothetical protein